VSAAIILSANPNIRKKSIQAGLVIAIPDAGANPSGSQSSESALTAPTLPSFKGDFILPAQGYDYGILDANNGVDIVNSCGTPVVAAADGIVVPDANIPDSLGGWNNGYGNFVLLEHAFGNDIFTRYAHLEQSLVQIGSFVKQGQEIGLMGQTGGVSACELDFEVIGAQNPFVK
jgi:murein DD-endopeptidase MepM/ murein hydrolase activator NlpD